MTNQEKRVYLLNRLIAEQPQYAALKIPADMQGQKNLLRSLFNVRPPLPIDAEFLKIQDSYLQEELMKKGTTDLADLSPVCDGIYLWKGDITTLKCDAIVNAANSQMLGCFVPCHGCIDNAIHTWAGIQLRLACRDLMEAQGHAEPTGTAKITPAFNLPCSHVIHTVGPIVSGRLTNVHERQLVSCYDACLSLASQHDLRHIAFCCISTGEFHFPNERAAELAIGAVKKYRKQNSQIEVIFNVFKERDYEIYKQLLG